MLRMFNTLNWTPFSVERNTNPSPSSLTELQNASLLPLEADLYHEQVFTRSDMFCYLQEDGTFRIRSEKEHEPKQISLLHALLNERLMPEEASEGEEEQTNSEEVSTQVPISRRLLGIFDASAASQEYWLNDDIVNGWFHILKELYTLSKHKIEILDSQVALDFIEKTKKAKRIHIAKRNKALKQAHLILWPRYHQDHWYLIYFKKEKRQYTIGCLDSLNSDARSRLVTYGERFLEALYFRQKNFTLRYETQVHPVIRQDNFDDCGTSICYFGEKICQGVDLDIYEEHQDTRVDYSQFRIRIALEFLNQIQEQRKINQSDQTIKEKRPSITYQWGTKLSASPSFPSSYLSPSSPSSPCSSSSSSSSSPSRRTSPRLKAMSETAAISPPNPFRSPTKSPSKKEVLNDGFTLDGGYPEKSVRYDASAKVKKKLFKS